MCGTGSKAEQSSSHEIVIARLKPDPQQSADAYRAFVAKPHPDITPQALREVIDAVWDVERYPDPRGAPEKYMDLTYLATAQRAR